MVFGKKFFIILFTGFSSFVMLQIIFRKIYGLDMITFTDLMNFFSTFSYKNFVFDDTLVNFVYTIRDFKNFDFPQTDNVIDAIGATFRLFAEGLKMFWSLIVSWFDTFVGLFKDILYVISFVKDFFVFLFT